MYKNEFDNLMNQKKLQNAYMFYGQSHFLIDYYAKKVAAIHGESEDIEKIYYDDYDFKYCKNKLLQSSLFSSNNILLIKRDKKIPKTELEALIDACNTNPDSTLIFCYMDDNDAKTMENCFSPKKVAASVRFFAPKEYEALKILEAQAHELGLFISSSALNHLYFMHRQDLSLSVNDLYKLRIVDDEISTNEIDKHCFGIGAVSIENFLHSLFSSKDISSDIEALLDEGVNEVYLLSQITSFLQQLFMIVSYIRINGVANPKEILGYAPPKDVWEKKLSVANFLASKHGKFTELFEILLNLELELKSGKVSDSSAYLEAVLRKISATIR